MPRLTYANVTSTIALFLALGGTSYAVAKLPKNSVGSAQIKSGAVGNSELKGGAVTGDKLANGVAISGPRGPRGPEGAAGKDGAAGPAGAPGPAAPESWQNIGLVNSWQNYGGAYALAAFRKDGAGSVQLRGLLKRASATQSVIARLPAGYRPAQREAFITFADPDGTGSARIDIDQSGDIMYWSGTSNGGAISLSGISFAPGS